MNFAHILTHTCTRTVAVAASYRMYMDDQWGKRVLCSCDYKHRIRIATTLQSWNVLDVTHIELAYKTQSACITSFETTTNGKKKLQPPHCMAHHDQLHEFKEMHNWMRRYRYLYIKCTEESESVRLCCCCCFVERNRAF